jgi:hypothetical protein
MIEATLIYTIRAGGIVITPNPARDTPTNTHILDYNTLIVSAQNIFSFNYI